MILGRIRKKDISITYRVGTFDHVIDEGRIDYGKILPSNYVKTECMGPFLGGRCVEIWEKR